MLENFTPKLPDCPGDTAKRGKLKGELTGGQADLLPLHIELAPMIKLIIERTSNSCPGWPKFHVPHYGVLDRSQRNPR